ncbi:hypothetical protein DH2020_000391 [Rehmannia glutinosa]|uniref:FAF domain-containing protein n=1 Tax=Rehmannia glutinosa TaxID=99300 RepID=A0ABR0XWC9_REHGL
MAACGSLEHIFEKPLPENQTFLESLSPWKHIKSIDESSFTELFGELHFKENNNNNHVAHSPESSSSPSSSSSSLSSGPAFSARPGIDIPQKHNNFQNKNDPKSSYHPTSQKKQYKHSDSFSSMNSESLSLCTEGLGFESFGDVEDVLKNDHHVHQGQRKRNLQTENHYKISATSRGEFPPPISCIGQSGKPWVLFKSYRQDGRFILKEIRIPTQEFLHACREDGRLRLQFIQSDDEILEEDDEEDEKNEDDEGKIGEQSLENRDCNCNGSS